MSLCGLCGREFSPGDNIDPGALKLPAFVRPLIAPQLSRLLLFRCPAQECNGLITALFLPRTDGVTQRNSAEASGVTPST